MMPAADPVLLDEMMPLLLTLGLVVFSLWALSRWLRAHELKNRDAHLPRQMLQLGAYGLGALLVLLSLPVSETTRGQMLSFLGLIVTALIALSSTTLVANAMAGLLLRIINSFRPGDFIRVGDHFGRVSERGLFHTEIQTEDRDLMTLPNMHLITNPVTVVHQSGTIISASLTLGYDVHHRRIEAVLREAALAAGLTDPFVQVRELGDFSVSYRLGGRLEEVGSLLTARSQLRCEILDALHGAGIEIASPNIMLQRKLEQALLPEAWHPPRTAEEAPKLEDVVFDKAEQAGRTEQQRKELAALGTQLEAARAADPVDEEQIARLEADIARLQEDIASQEQAAKDAKASGGSGAAPAAAS